MGRRYVERACESCATSQVHVLKHIYKPLETESACVVSTEKKSIRCSGEKNQCNYFTEDCVKKQIFDFTTRSSNKDVFTDSKAYLQLRPKSRAHRGHVAN